MNLFRLLAVPASLAAPIALFSPSKVDGLVDLPYGGLFINAETEAAYTSNLFLTADEESDMIFTVLPGLEYLLAEGVVHVEAHVGVEFIRFADWSRFDAENFKSRALLSFPHEDRGRMFFLQIDGGFDEVTSATAADGALLQEDVASAGAGLEYFFSDRSSARLRGNYRDRDARTAGFASRRTATLRAGPAFAYSDRLTMTGALRYRNTDVSGATPALDSEDYALLVGAEGRLLALLVGEVAVGVQRREFDGDFDAQTEPYAFVGLTWEADAQTEITLSLSSDMETSASNLSGQTVRVSLEAGRGTGEYWRFRLGGGYEDSTYVRAAGGRRNDDEWWVLGGVDYVLNRHVTLGCETTFAQRGSDFSNANYDAVRAALFAEARF